MTLSFKKNSLNIGGGWGQKMLKLNLSNIKKKGWEGAGKRGILY